MKSDMMMILLIFTILLLISIVAVCKYQNRRDLKREYKLNKEEINFLLEYDNYYRYTLFTKYKIPIKDLWNLNYAETMQLYSTILEKEKIKKDKLIAEIVNKVI